MTSDETNEENCFTILKAEKYNKDKYTILKTSVFFNAVKVINIFYYTFYNMT